MNQLNRKLIREFWHAKGLLLAITLMIALGVMCLVTMQSAYRNLLAAKIDYYHQCQMAHFWIDLKKVALSDIPDLSKYPSIRTLDSRLSFPATLDWHLKPEPLNCKVVSLPDRPKNHLCKIILHRGTYFTERNSNEVILSTKFAESNEIQPGDSVHLLLNNRREEFTVVGTAYSSEFTYMTPPGELLPSPENYGICYLKRSYAEELFDFQAAANQLLGEFHPLPDSSKYRLLEDLKQELEPYGLIRGTLLKDQTSNQFLTNEIQGVASFSFFLPTVFLTVAALVLNVLMTRLAKRQRVVIGTFKALGYTDGQLFLYFLKFGFVVGVAGSLCGSFFGILLAGGMTALYGYFFEFPNLISEVFWYPHFIGLVASLFCSVLGSIFGARHSLKLQPAEAMRAEAPIQGGHIWLERLSSFWQALSPSWRLALRSLFRARLRSLSNFIAAMMGTAILSSGLLMTSSQVFFIDFQFDKTMRSDVDLALKNIQGRQVVDEVLDLPGVYYAEPSYLYGCTLRNGHLKEEIGITGLLPDARLTVPYDTNNEPLQIPSQGVVLSSYLAQKLKVSLGDKIELKPVEGDRRVRHVPVTAIADSYLGMTAYANIYYLSEIADEPFACNSLQLLVEGGIAPSETFLRSLKELPRVESVSTRSRTADRAKRFFFMNQLISIGVMIGFAGTIFFASVLNSGLVNLAERQREVATFIAFGYSPWEIGNTFLRENMTLHLAGTLAGLPLGILLSSMAINAVNNDLLRLPLVISWSSFVGTFLVSILFAIVAHLVVQRHIHRMNCLEALNVKE